MDPNNYFIKQGYRSLQENVTLSKNPDDLYWTPRRVELSRYYQYHVYVYARELAIQRKLRSVVDVGCGVARKLMEHLAPVCERVAGVDQREAVDYCRSHYERGEFFVEDLERPETEIGAFDLVICADVIEHLVEPDNILEFIKRLSHRDSVIVLSTPDRDLARGKSCMASPKAEHVREWNREEFRAYLESRGLRVLDQTLTLFIKPVFDLHVSAMIAHSLITRGTARNNQIVLCALQE